MKNFIFVLFICSIKKSFEFPQNKTEEKQETNVIKELQFNLKNLTDDFNDFNIRIITNLKDRFDQEEKHIAEQIHTLRNNILPETHALNAIQEEEEESLDYKTAQENLEEILKNSTDKIRQCQFNELFFDFAPIYLHIDFTIKMSYDLIDNLESMREGCAYSNNEETCLMNSKLGVEILFNNLNDSVNRLRKLADEKSTVVLSVFEQCVSKEISSLKDKTQSILKQF